MGYNIAIDGPAGAGKSTIARLLAKELSFIYVDTGALYRAMAVYFLRKGIAEANEAEIAKASKEAAITIQYQDGEQQVYLNDENITAELRSEQVGNMASISSAYKEVRNQLLELQRQLAEKEDVVMDGRDIGTYVLPDADLKIFLTASAGARAARRYQELLDKGAGSSYEEVERDITLRDSRDINRENSPLRQADDAVLVDTSDLSIPEVIEKIRNVYMKNE